MTSHSFPELVGKLGRLPGELNTCARRGVTKAALATVTEIRGEIRLATGGSMRLSGVGRRGARVGARYDIKGTVNPTALVRATGPLQLIEHTTKPHTIKPRKRRGTVALHFADGAYAARAHHPGTKGKHPFEKGATAAAPRTPEIFQKEMGQAVIRAMA